jgi:hypothetical protein
VLARSISLYLQPVVPLLVTPFKHMPKLFCIMLMLAHILRFIELNINSNGHIKIKYTYILKEKCYIYIYMCFLISSIAIQFFFFKSTMKFVRSTCEYVVTVYNNDE